MLIQHKNALLKAITKLGFNPELFQAETEKPKVTYYSAFQEWWDTGLPFAMFAMEDSLIFSISLKDSPFKFSIRVANHNFNLFTFKCTIFEPTYPQTNWSNKVRGIDKLLTKFELWLKEEVSGYLEDQAIPDLWMQLETYKSFINEPDITKESTSDFSEDEKENLRNSVEKFKLLVKENFKPNKEQTEFINEQLDYLSNALERLNRFDWRGLAISTVLSIAVNLSVDTEKGKLLFSLFQQAFQAIHKLLQ